MKRTVGAAALLLGGACGAQAQDVTVGWTSYPADIPVIADAIDGGKTEAEKLGVGLEFALSEGAAAQANAVDNLLALGVDVIAIDPEASKASGPSVE
jgi:ABC-type sugar transport system substrate-binding protein